MKRFLFLAFAVFSLNISAQKGFFERTELNAGYNFVKGNGSLAFVGGEMILGYAFSEKFDLGLGLLPIYTTSFRENGVKYSRVQFGFGINTSVRFYRNETISLRAMANLGGGISANDENTEIDITRLNLGVQCFFENRQKMKPFVCLGVSPNFISVKQNDTTKEYNYTMPYIGFGFLVKL